MSEVTTPSGLRIEFTEYPRGYKVNGEEVPSVTKVLGVLDKPALKWWGMKVGVEGMVELIDRYAWRTDGLPDNITAEKALEWLKREQLTVNSVSKQAAKRGKGAHDALERFVKTGEIPDPREFPLPDRGFVKALTDWLDLAKPELVMAEVMVGSVEHQYAGRFDLLVRIEDMLYLIDLKTSAKARIYDEALLQLAGYSACLSECGYPEPDRKAVVCVAADGTYTVKQSEARPEHFYCILAAYRAVNEVKTLHQVRAAA